MTINTERLKTDSAYWDECDPSGGEATHYCPEDEFHNEGWLKGNKNNAFFMFAGGGSWHAGSKIESNSIPRPTPTAAEEWDGEGLPPVGCDCEIMTGHGWEHCNVIGYDGTKCVVFVDGYGYIGIDDGSSFRPIQDSEEVHRRDLLRRVNLAIEEAMNFGKDPAEYLDKSRLIIKPMPSAWTHKQMEDLSIICRRTFNQYASSSSPNLWSYVANAIIEAGWRKEPKS